MTTTLLSPQAELETDYPLTPDQIAQFERDGYIKLKEVLSAETLAYYRPEVKRLVREFKPIDPASRDATYGKAFTQLENMWRLSDKVKEITFSRRLARIATELLQVNGVRLYHDHALFKEIGGNYTPWHVDQFYWPLASEKTVTAWIPLHAVPLENGPLSFSAGSQRLLSGRELEISEESERRNAEQLKLSNFPVDETPYDLGEVSFHLGFNFHRAGPNKLEQPREVMTVIYLDEAMRLAEPKNKNQVSDWHNWCPGVKVGEVINSPLNPVLYSRA